ncbi:hypothetical protein MTR_7g082410 [Medicago truncatula]|uniref:Uncharacterized protein n=1 Tax=Medicago truncatula TaxID=3880 RepID=G7KUD0_MEDTR|nr:hypothetical protein MTR_7g082410 [Medicago truncatula]
MVGPLPGPCICGSSSSCVDSSGVCGNDGRTEFRCFSKDGLHATTCNSPIVSSSSKFIISLSQTLVYVCFYN